MMFILLALFSYKNNVVVGNLDAIIYTSTRGCAHQPSLEYPCADTINLTLRGIVLHPDLSQTV